MLICKWVGFHCGAMIRGSSLKPFKNAPNYHRTDHGEFSGTIEGCEVVPVKLCLHLLQPSRNTRTAACNTERETVSEAVIEMFLGMQRELNVWG